MRRKSGLRIVAMIVWKHVGTKDSNFDLFLQQGRRHNSLGRDMLYPKLQAYNGLVR